MGALFDPPQYQPPPPDPALAQLQAQSVQQNQQAIQTQVQGDSAKIMSMYGAASTAAGAPVSLSSGQVSQLPGFGMNSLTALIANGAKA